APLPPETELSRQMTTSTTSIDIMGLQAAYANLHTDQERDYFMQRYHDVISSFGGKTSYDADNRPLLVIRSNLWALNIYNNYFNAPWMPDRTEANPNELNQDDARYRFRCCPLSSIGTAPLPPETELSRQMT